ncbi:MAG: thiamine pyrophosphate-binding protein [Alphaproteobacteria bacterium]|nr:thiamine pyrophosphate-binding protein [Alphaproteobacteria bacterium]
MTQAKTGGRLLVECLLNQGVTTAYGVPGESYLEVLDALYDVKNQIWLIGARNEGGAAFMAEAYGKLTGKPGICFVTRGPGATNAAIGLHTARQNSSPMILFVGQIGRNMRQREAFQEIDYRAFFGDVAKWVTEIDSADRISEILGRAFATAMSGRPGPVVVALPEDMLRDQTHALAGGPVVISEAAPAQSDLDRAVELLTQAKKPLVMVGGGGWSDTGRQNLQRFVERNNLPAAVAFRYQDLIDNRSDAYVGDAGVGMSKYLQDMIREADLLLAINIRFGESTTDGWKLIDVPSPRQTLIHSHGSDSEIGKIYQADAPIHAGPNELMRELCQLPVLGDWGNWRDQGRAGFKSMRTGAKQQGAVDMVAISRWLNETLANDVIITNGAGNFAAWPSKFIDFFANRRLLAPQSGAMGAGFPAAIAAKSVDKTRQVVCFAGDGDFQMTLAEMGTAMQEGLQPIILLLNNGIYGTIRVHQERRYPSRNSGTTIKNPNFVGLAKAYGFYAKTVKRTEDFEEAFVAAAASTSGGLIELMIDPQDVTPFSSLDEIREAGIASQK